LGLPYVGSVISGGADGIDTAAADTTCISRRSHVEIAVPDALWDDIGWQAGPLRNAAMSRLATHAFGIWDGESTGTQWAIAIAAAEIGAENVLVATITDDDSGGFDITIERSSSILAKMDDRFHTAVSAGRPFAGLPER
jgi:hypothetical protein